MVIELTASAAQLVSFRLGPVLRNRNDSVGSGWNGRRMCPSQLLHDLMGCVRILLASVAYLAGSKGVAVSPNGLLASYVSMAQQNMDSIRLNDIRIVASHNSYKKKPHPKVLKFLTKFQDKLGAENNPDFIDYGHLFFEEQFTDYGIRGASLDDVPR